MRRGSAIADPAGATTTNVSKQHHRFSGLYLAAFPGLLGSWLLHVWTGGVHWGPIDTPGSPAATTVAVFLLALVAVGLGFVAWNATAHHREHRAWIQPTFAGSVFSVVAVFAVSMGVGPHWWWSGIFVIVCWICAAIWTVGTRTSVTREHRQEHDGESRQSLKDMLGLNKMTKFFSKVEHDEDGEPIRVKVKVHHAGGDTADEVAAALPKMESMLGTPRNLSSVEGDSDRADRSEINLLLKDPFKGTSPLGPLTAPGKSIAEYTSVGDYAKGGAAFVTIANGIHQPTPTSFALIGTTRSGKTSTENGLITDWGSRCDWVCLYLNQAKGMQDVRPLLPVIEALVIAEDASEESLAAYIQAYKNVRRIAGYRERILGEFGLRAWSPRCGDPDPDRRPKRGGRTLEQMPFLTVHTGEADSILASFKAQEHAMFIASKGLSLGINSGWSLQSPDWSSMPTKLRSNLGLWFIHGLGDGGQTEMVIENPKLRAQMHPEYWGQSKPGQHYMMGAGVDEKLWPVAIKTRFRVGDEFHPDGTKVSFDELEDRWAAELLRRNEESAKRMAKLDKGSADATNGWWAEQATRADQLRYEVLVAPQDGPRNHPASHPASHPATTPQVTPQPAVRLAGPQPRNPQPATDDDALDEEEYQEFLRDHREEVREIEQEGGTAGVALYDDPEDPQLAGDTRKHDLRKEPATFADPGDLDPLASAADDGRPPVLDRDGAVQVLDQTFQVLLAEKADPRVPGTALIQVKDVMDACPSSPFRTRQWVSGEFGRLATGDETELAKRWGMDPEGARRKGLYRLSAKGRTDHRE